MSLSQALSLLKEAAVFKINTAQSSLLSQKSGAPGFLIKGNFLFYLHPNIKI